MSKYQFQLVFYQNITPLHIGCGQEVGLVDNPIIREKTTGFPFIPGSGIRGVLRDKCEGKPEWKTLFGPEPDEDLGENDHAGCISIHDAKILFFPVRTNVGLFHWITCPFVIERFNRDQKYFDNTVADFKKVEKINPPQGTFIAIEKINNGKGLFLEEFPFSQNISANTVAETDKPETLLKNWITDNKNNFGFSTEDQKKVFIVNNADFDYFAQHATIVMQHNRLTSAKTVAEGALFSAESIPPETLFYGIIGGTKARKQDNDNFKSEIKSADKAIEKLLEYIRKDSETHAVITLGGNESTGLGVTKMFWSQTNGQTVENETENK